LKKNQLILGLIFLAILVALGAYAQHQHPFDFHAFIHQFQQADWTHIGIAAAAIYLAYVFRAVRWALLIRHNKRVGLFSLLGTQVIGFTAVALIGRVADFIRPYLVSRKTGLPVSTQIATYIVERLFDAGSMALLFSLVIALAPRGSLPHQEIFYKVAYWGLGGTAAGAIFLVAVRLAGGAVASFFQRVFSIVSKGFGHSIGNKIRSFRTGLDTLRTPLDLALTLGLSLCMWSLITLAYFETATAFVASPELAQMTLPQCMVILGASGGASVFQLPVLGWFTQIGAVAATFSKLFNVAPEPATACAATLLLVTFLGIVPVGLIWAQFEHISFRKIAHESEHAAETVEESKEENQPPPEPRKA
jgi:uncharacterized membrane protein YbhN (UPF0104 family)